MKITLQECKEIVAKEMGYKDFDEALWLDNVFFAEKIIDLANKMYYGQSEWISVEDRLPNQIGSYLCFWENCYVGMLFFNSDKEWCEMWEQKKHNPTHWQPLPKQAEI